MAKSKPAKSDAPSPADDPRAEYTVVARRYRPQQLADLIGQEHVAQALANALKSGRIAHAYLFTGARGVGKTSAARILAKALNCVTGPTSTPCDGCDICRSVAAGDDVDVLEIDGASNNKVDEVRDLRNNVGFRPARARYKVYIIDEVHMLSNSAFNALLKTLEEPPPHVKFIFATTEVQKIPVTILSRCQRFDFAHIGPAKVFATLKHIVVKEGLQADDDALQLIARRAGGSMRDAQSLLDQLLAFADGRLTAETMHALLGTAGDDRVADLADAILNQDAKRAVELVGEYADRGLQLGELIDQLIDYWRGLMLTLVGGPTFRDLPGTPAFQDRIRGHAAGRNLDTVMAGLDVLTTTKTKVRASPHMQVLLELAVVRLSRLGELLSVAQLAQWVGSDGNGASPAPALRTVLPEDIAKKKSLTGGEPIPNGSPHQMPMAGPIEVTSKNWPEVWESVLRQLGPMKSESLKLSGLPAILGPNSVEIGFPTRYSHAYDFCSDTRTVNMIEAALKAVSGKGWTVRVVRTEAGPAEMIAPAPAVAPDRKKDILQRPLFRKIVAALEGQLVRVDDGFDPDAAPDWQEKAAGLPAAAAVPDPDEV